MRNPDIDFAAKAQQLADRLEELGQVSDEPARLVRTFLSPASLRANEVSVANGQSLRISQNGRRATRPRGV